MSEAKKTLAALILIQILFGLNYSISKIVLEHFPPIVWSSFRIIISVLMMVTVALITKRPHPKMERGFFVPLILFSLLGCIINQVSFLYGLKLTTATNSAILNTLIPVFTLLIVTILGYEKLTTHKFFGFTLAFGGILILRNVESMRFSNETFIGDLLNIVNCLSYSIFLAISKRFLEKYDRLWTTIWMFIYGSLGIGAIALPSWLTFQWPTFDLQLLLCMLYAIIGGTIFTYFLSIWTLARVKSSYVAIFIYLQPIVTTPMAWLMFGEVPTLRTLFSLILIFSGMLLARERATS